MRVKVLLIFSFGKQFLESFTPTPLLKLEMFKKNIQHTLDKLIFTVIKQFYFRSNFRSSFISWIIWQSCSTVPETWPSRSCYHNDLLCLKVMTLGGFHCTSHYCWDLLRDTDIYQLLWLMSQLINRVRVRLVDNVSEENSRQKRKKIIG